MHPANDFGDLKGWASNRSLQRLYVKTEAEMNRFGSTAAALLLCCAAAQAAQCPSWYPSNFPCIGGFEEYAPPAPTIVPPGFPMDYKPIGLSYRQAPLSLFSSVVSAAKADGWSLSNTEQQLLYGRVVVNRGVLEKAQQRVIFSVFPGPQGAIIIAVGR
jgi:hypothetical protein